MLDNLPQRWIQLVHGNAINMKRSSQRNLRYKDYMPWNANGAAGEVINHAILKGWTLLEPKSAKRLQERYRTLVRIDSTQLNSRGINHSNTVVVNAIVWQTEEYTPLESRKHRKHRDEIDDSQRTYQVLVSGYTAYPSLECPSPFQGSFEILFFHQR